MDLLLFLGAKFGGIEVVKWVFMALMIENIIEEFVFLIEDVINGEGEVKAYIITAIEYIVILVILMLLGAPLAGIVWVMLILQLIDLVVFAVGGVIPIGPIFYTILNIIGIILVYKTGIL